MNRIRLLPEQVANQIAAGEVIERPASVVKELVENSLDASAAQVHVEIQAGGRSLIRVMDDGIGMSRDDALLCLERHATSKIRVAEDLSAIATMGFRGEALPSIASVSRFSLVTRERDSDSPEGTRIHISGGKIVEVKAAGAAPGTTIEVRQIFFNLPARRKFLRSEETESAHIQHYLTLAALAYPEVGFSFQKDGRQVWRLPAIPAGEGQAGRLTALRERLRALYGGELKLLPLDFKAQLEPWRSGDHAAEEGTPATAGSAEFRLWGFIGGPGVSRATREEQHLFVNRRPVENRGLNFALLEGYHTALMKGRYPVCCLFLEIDPAAVDVNIHPAKREVRFHREMDVRRLVVQAVRQTLLGFHNQSSPANAPEPPRAPQESQTQPPTFGPSFELRFDRPGPPRPEQAPLRMGFTPSPAPPDAPAAVSSPNPDATPGEFRPESPKPWMPGPAAVNPPEPTAPPPSKPETPANPVNPNEPVPLLKVPLRLLGVIGRLYVVLESDRGLVLLDQHAAHERILFEQMLERLESGGQAPSQKLLLPATIELSARDAAFARDNLVVLTRLGVGLSEFGERTFLLDALPPFVKSADPRAFVIELIDNLKAAGQEVNSMRLGEHTVAKTVCRHAVKANDPLAGPELEKLVEQLRHCAMPYTCPHGRPTLIEMNFRELEKKFGRTQ
jgi:DNA mismatch repair protein MutL